MSISVIAGLGNPGSKYENTRHNIGFSIVDLFAKSFSATWKIETRFRADTASILHEDRKLLLVKPKTFMNDSGLSIAAVLNYQKLPASALVVIYDDITLDFGRAKLSTSGRSGGHNGIADILNRIEPSFLRYRIGIGSKPNKQMDLSDYVLSKFSPSEQKILADQNPTYLKHLQLIIDKEPALAMNSINQRTALTHEHNKN